MYVGVGARKNNLLLFKKYTGGATARSFVAFADESDPNFLYFNQYLMLMLILSALRCLNLFS
jgi:hypothetical protein